MRALEELRASAERAMAHSFKKIKILLIALAVFSTDLITKWWATNEGLVTRNTGVSFSIFSAIPHEVLATVLLLVLGGVGYVLIKEKRSIPAIGLLLGGGFANILDRIWFEAVRDWIPIPGLEITNNLADWAIFCGVAWLVIQSYNQEKKKHHEHTL
jgi:lipoprotein signal peptidase